MQGCHDFTIVHTSNNVPPLSIQSYLDLTIARAESTWYSTLSHAWLMCSQCNNVVSLLLGSITFIRRSFNEYCCPSIQFKISGAEQWNQLLPMHGFYEFYNWLWYLSLTGLLCIESNHVLRVRVGCLYNQCFVAPSCFIIYVVILAHTLLLWISRCRHRVVMTFQLLSIKGCPCRVPII